MSKKNKGNKTEEVNGKKIITPKTEKEITVDTAKKAQTIDIVNKLCLDKDFPKISQITIESLAKTYGVAEKSVTLFADRLKKFYTVVAKKKEKKGKALETELNDLVKESTLTMAIALATKLFKTTATLVKIIVTKKSNVKNMNACGKAFFSLGNTNKEYFMYWEYRNGNVFAGSTLHEKTSE
jgi:hypothetical protein